jgi:hypothetical protein
MTRVLIDNKKGRPGMMQTLVLLKSVVAECQRRTDEPELARTLELARSAVANLATADERKRVAQSELKHAHYLMCESYDQARLIALQVRAQLHGLYGFDEETLARFGMRPFRVPQPIVARVQTEEVLP